MVKRANGVKGRRKGLNKHQRAAFREGEERIGREEIRALLQLSESKDPADRLQAASLLCPCHVRKRIEEVWAAISDYAERGKCDFCGESNARVKKDFTTEFEGRFALVCEPCDQVA